jgi:hypothetical protein
VQVTELELIGVVADELLVQVGTADRQTLMPFQVCVCTRDVKGQVIDHVHVGISTIF